MEKEHIFKKYEVFFGFYVFFVLICPLLMFVDSAKENYHMHSFEPTQLPLLDMVVFLALVLLYLSSMFYFIYVTNEAANSHKNNCFSADEFNHIFDINEDNHKKINRFFDILEERAEDRRLKMDEYKESNIRLYEIMKTEKAEIEEIAALYQQHFPHIHPLL